FQAEDGIRDFHVTGVQTCALPICRPLNGQHSVFVLSGQVQWDTGPKGRVAAGMDLFNKGSLASVNAELADSDRWALTQVGVHGRSEERRVEKEGRSRRAPRHGQNR